MNDPSPHEIAALLDDQRAGRRDRHGSPVVRFVVFAAVALIVGVAAAAFGDLVLGWDSGVPRVLLSSVAVGVFASVAKRRRRVRGVESPVESEGAEPFDSKLLRLFGYGFLAVRFLVAVVALFVIVAVSVWVGETVGWGYLLTALAGSAVGAFVTAVLLRRGGRR